jgi:hypothetical protein
MAKKVVNLASEELRALMRQRGGLSGDVFREWAARFPGLDREQLCDRVEEIVRTDPAAFEVVLTHFIKAILDDETFEVPPEMQVLKAAVLDARDEHERLSGKREAKRREVERFFDALERLDEDLIFAFFGKVLDEAQREQLPDVEPVDERLAALCVEWGLPRPPDDMDLAGMAKRSL